MGKHPSGKGTAEFRLPTKIVLDLRSRGYYKKFLELFTIEAVLQEPVVIFEGLHKAGFDHGFCYCGVPKMRYTGEDGSTAQAHPGVLFAIFVNRDRIIFEFGWERMDGDKFDYPENSESRFTSRVFPN